MNEVIFMVEEDPGGGYNANALGMSIFTQGDTIEELKTNIRDALKCHFENEADIPKVIRLHQIKEEVFAYS